MYMIFKKNLLLVSPYNIAIYSNLCALARWLGQNLRNNIVYYMSYYMSLYRQKSYYMSATL